MKTGVCSYCKVVVVLDSRDLITEHQFEECQWNEDCEGARTTPETVANVENVVENPIWDDFYSETSQEIEELLLQCEQ